MHTEPVPIAKPADAAPDDVPADIRARVQTLRAELLAHNRAYYEEDAPTVEDSVYDGLFLELQQLVHFAEEVFLCLKRPRLGHVEGELLDLGIRLARPSGVVRQLLANLKPFPHRLKMNPIKMRLLLARHRRTVRAVRHKDQVFACSYGVRVPVFLQKQEAAGDDKQIEHPDIGAARMFAADRVRIFTAYRKMRKRRTNELQHGNTSFPSH
ncbi:MAG: hypothetical protein K6T31_08495 [Alicyclobacillus sp.]|nr:hypothetical protein [Alicyclobacillus sp.]